MRAGAPPVQHLLRGGYKRDLHAFQGGQRHHGRFGAPEEEKGGEGAGRRGEATAGESVLATPLWGMLHADDAGIVSQSPEQLMKMMGVIVVVCAAFGLTVSDAKTEIIMYVFTREGDAGVHRHIQRRGNGPGAQPDERVCIPRGERQPQYRPVQRGRLAHTQRMMQLPKYNLELYMYNRPSAPLELKIRMLIAEVLETMMYGCVAWTPRACHYDTLHRAHHRFLTRCIGWRKHNRVDHPISYLDTFMKTRSESIEATLRRRRRILFARFVARMEDTRLPKYVMFGELVGGAGCVGVQEKEWTGCFLDDLRAFGINADEWTTAAQDKGE